MKATTIIIAAVLSLQLNLLFAGNPKSNLDNRLVNKEVADLNLILLAPVTPSEAGFNDVIPDPAVNVTKLAPVTPVEADFDDNVPETETGMINLAPHTPSAADFNGNDSDQMNTDPLIPVTPSEADFE